MVLQCSMKRLMFYMFLFLICKLDDDFGKFWEKHPPKVTSVVASKPERLSAIDAKMRNPGSACSKFRIMLSASSGQWNVQQDPRTKDLPQDLRTFLETFLLETFLLEFFFEFFEVLFTFLTFLASTTKKSNLGATDQVTSPSSIDSTLFPNRR